MRGERWLLGGLFLTTLATLLLEVLDSRLLSVLTWYHLAFLAVSMAMLGMSGGAVAVFLCGDRFRGEAARRALSRYAIALAVAIPVSHAVNLSVPIPVVRSLSPNEIASVAIATLAMAIPFFLSGVVVTIALTRVGGAIGKLYGVDLLGAALGCLMMVLLLDHFDLTSTAIATGAIAAGGAACFASIGDAPRRRGPLLLFGALLVAALLNASADDPLGVTWAKERNLGSSEVALRAWNNHSYVVAHKPRTSRPFFWGPGRGADGFSVESSLLLIDGEAGTPVTRWDGRPESIAWVQYDVTSLPYHLRSGDALVIGVGGGRDILSALWAGSRSVTGVEVNGSLVEILEGSHRDYAKIATRPEVTLVHDEGRSFLTRTDRRFDVIQMSLIDTWAATGAGAFTLSENGLYTVEAWRVFLDRLAPEGILSVSRWFSPADVSETSRLLALAVATLISRGVENPAAHLALVSSGPVATLLTSPSPLRDRDITALREISERLSFEVRAAPGTKPSHPMLARILASRTPEMLEAAIQNPYYDYSPPTDNRPYFFNILKPGSFYRIQELKGASDLFGIGGVVSGNTRATTTLVVLFCIATLLVAAVILVPLLIAGRPAMSRAAFGWSLLYFAIIGFGFMLMQVPFLQRFSVYLGHPTYTFSIILFSMILFAGLGSLVSDRVRIPEGPAPWLVPLGVAAGIAVLMQVMQPVIDASIGRALPLRCLVVVGLIAPVSFFAGFCFPIGMRLVGRHSDQATAWMWGVNGACSVLASILAVAISLWSGIDTSLAVAGVLYLGLAGVSWQLARGTA